ncbi:MAG: DUF58 domain-containing protein [Planctomycetota bacterium]
MAKSQSTKTLSASGKEEDGPLLSPALLAQLERMELVSRKIFRGRMKGERRSKRKGQSVEFADFRNYVPGDDLRFIDWNMYARLDKLFLKLFLEEEDLHFYALVDSSLSMTFGSPSKFRYAKQLAGALGYIGLCRADRVKIEALDGSKVNKAPVLRGRTSMWRMVEHLEAMKAGSTATLNEAVRSFCLRNTGKGILVIITDLMDKTGYESALRYLTAQNMDVYLIHVLSQEEIDPEITGDLRLVDCEDSDIAEISVSQRLIDRYRQTLASFIEKARDFASRRGIVYMMTSTERPVDRLVSRYLRQRGLVR